MVEVSVKWVCIRTYYHKKFFMMLRQVEDLLAHIVYCGCVECTLYIMYKSVGYDLILNCCSILYYVLIVYLKPDYFFVFFWLDAGRLAKSQYLEGPVTSHFVLGFSWFLRVLEQMLDGS